MRQGSNLRPAVLETAALPAELLTYKGPTLRGRSPFCRVWRQASLSRLAMERGLPFEWAEFFLFQPTRTVAAALRRRVVSPLAVRAGQGNNIARHVRTSFRDRTQGSHWKPARRPCGGSSRTEVRVGYSTISVTLPAPTVRPPSRMAKRRVFSMAMGQMSSTFMVMLSPGRTISTPSGNWITPVTSVVRK